MFNIITHAHSGMRYPILIILIWAIIQAFLKPDNEFKNRNLALGGLILVHIQVLLGFFLYFTSEKVQLVSGMMKDASMRFYGMEHILGMVVAAIIITIGFSKAKKNGNKSIGKFYLIGLILILLSIPWPFRIIGGSWF